MTLLRTAEDRDVNTTWSLPSQMSPAHGGKLVFQLPGDKAICRNSMREEGQ